MKLRFVISLLALATATPVTSMAADWPAHPIHFIVPFPAGGSTDVAARVVGNYLSLSLGQQVVVKISRAPTAMSAWSMWREVRRTVTRS